MEDIFVIKTEKDWSRFLSEVYSGKPGQEFYFRLDIDNNTNYINPKEYFARPEFHNME